MPRSVLCEDPFTSCRNWWPATSPRAGSLELRGEPEEGGLITEAAEKCTPMGSPASFHHNGTDIGGLPIMLATTLPKTHEPAAWS
jgi:hypothetical protein